MPTDAEHAERRTHARATVEQIRQARADARRKLADADTYWTPERREQAFAEFRQRLHDAAA